ncbi:hypothetical protein PHJA_001312200 [Phtheirospermum japonicum]|uniref:EF-hand domain-containing protein n=1 Tax=Phtheirospermum japonicum TaxID=374723 RepID=A0A830C0J8_9LAMI|nr:hypothetical protein PHJA_001312200 [Phtheirospermum japonicum]
MFLLCYFFYQLFEPSIQKRHLMYIKHEHLVVDVVSHIQNQTRGKLLTKNGSPNVSTIRRLFREKDQDGDNVISSSELKDFLQEIKSRKLQSDKNNSTSAEIMKEFDIDNNQEINEDEFVNGMSKWLDDAKDAMNKRYHLVKSLKGLYQVRFYSSKLETIYCKNILKHLQNAVYGSLLTEDGNPDIPALKRLFREKDQDGDNVISSSELKEFSTRNQE